MTDLMTGKSPNLQQYCVVPRRQRSGDRKIPGYRFQSLAFDYKNRLFEPLMVTLDPEKNQSISLVTHGGQEFNLCSVGQGPGLLGGKAVDLGTETAFILIP
jgi:hypothetical protein